MKNCKKLYETPELTVLFVSDPDVLTSSDNDAIWDDNWNDPYIFS